MAGGYIMSRKTSIIWMLIILMTIQIFAKAVFANSMIPGPGPESNQYTYETVEEEQIPCELQSFEKKRQSKRNLLHQLRLATIPILWATASTINIPGSDLFELNFVRVDIKGRKCQPTELIVKKEEHIFNGQYLPPENGPEINENDSI